MEGYIISMIGYLFGIFLYSLYFKYEDKSSQKVVKIFTCIIFLETILIIIVPSEDREFIGSLMFLFTFVFVLAVPIGLKVIEVEERRNNNQKNE